MILRAIVVCVRALQRLRMPHCTLDRVLLIPALCADTVAIQVQRVEAALVALIGGPLPFPTPPTTGAHQVTPHKYICSAAGASKLGSQGMQSTSPSEASQHAMPASSPFPYDVEADTGRAAKGAGQVSSSPPYPTAPATSALAEEEQLAELRRRSSRTPALLGDVMRVATLGQATDSAASSRMASLYTESVLDSKSSRAPQRCSTRVSSDGGSRPSRASSTSTRTSSSARLASRPKRSVSSASFATRMSRSTKYAMLSYQWDHQTEVVEMRKLLEGRGVKCWMDVDNMNTDIYDSMAEGVSGAMCIISCMSPAYQESENCKLELKFAQQSGVPIVPVMMQPDWKASGWLGIITAGTLYVQMHGDMPACVGNLMVQVQRTLESRGFDSAEEDDPSDFSSTEDEEHAEFTVEDMRGELERLMQDLRMAKRDQEDHLSASGSGRLLLTSPTGGSTLCPLPAIVPMLPPGLRVTSEMLTLKSALLESRGNPQIGFCGMGGIGKTVVSSWLVRSSEIRKKYEQVVWVTFGMTPVIDKCQRGLYLQLCANDMPRDLSAGEIRQSLKNAFANKSVLLVLDDVWEQEHANAFIFIDDATESTVLISSRVRGVLEGGTIVDIGLPSDEDAMKMLLSEAGLNIESEDAPKEAAEVVRFCNNLPLAIGIAGSLLKRLSLGDDWSGVLAVLREEFGEGGKARSMENSVIKTSLKSIKSSHDEVVQLFTAFALVPEDTVCPLDVLSCMYAAAGEALGAKSKMRRTPPKLQLRKWLKILIDRSLVLGTVDRPQLHDIVLEYVFGTLSTAQMQNAHRAVVTQFQKRRPAGGWNAYNMTQGDLSHFYVVHEIDHHISSGWDKANPLEDTTALTWLDDHVQGRFDVIAIGAARHLGKVNMTKLADAAVVDGNYWAAAPRVGALSFLLFESGAPIADVAVLKRQILKYLKLVDCGGDSDMAFAKDMLESMSILRILKMWDPSDVDTFTERITELIASPVGMSDATMQYDLATMAYALPTLFKSDLVGFTEALDKMAANADLIYTKCQDEGNALQLKRAKMMRFGWHGLYFHLRTCKANKGMHPDVLFGKNGHLIEETFALYDFETDHDNFNGLFSFDVFTCCMGSSVKPLLLRYGEIGRAKGMLNWHFEQLHKCKKRYAMSGGLSNIAHGMGAFTACEMSVLLQKHAEGLALMKDAYKSFDEFDVNLRKCFSSMSIMGDLGKDADILMTYSSTVVHLKALWILLSPKGEIDVDVAFQDFPETGMAYLKSQHTPSLAQSHSQWIEFFSPVWPALAYEKYGMTDQALTYAEAATVDDPINGAGYCAWLFALAYGVKGRVLAGLGRTDEATAAFAAGEKVASENEYPFLEAIVLRDWNEALPSSSHAAADTARKYEAVMAKLGPGEPEALVKSVFLTW